MDEKQLGKQYQNSSMYPLPKGVIDAGVAKAEDAANAENIGNATNTDALVPVPQKQEKPTHRGRIEKIKNVGREAVDNLLRGNSITWHDTSGDSQEKGK